MNFGFPLSNRDFDMEIQKCYFKVLVGNLLTGNPRCVPNIL
jgi:hypothetical protein